MKNANIWCFICLTSLGLCFGCVFTHEGTSAIAMAILFSASLWAYNQDL